jgi:hypothetical protein
MDDIQLPMNCTNCGPECKHYNTGCIVTKHPCFEPAEATQSQTGLPVDSQVNGYNDLSLLEDVVQIAKYFAWQSDVGDKKAMDIIFEIHNGKYGSCEGIWPQVAKAVAKLKEL